MKTDKVLLVTGASSDVGCYTISQIEKNYSTIIAHYVHMNEQLQQIKDKLGDKLLLVQADFTDESQVQRMLEKIECDGLEVNHILHLPAQKLQNMKFAKCDWELYQKEIDISLRSAVLLFQRFLPKMAKRKNGKVVIMLSSCTLNMPPKYLGSYVPVKYALLGLVKSLAAEYAEKGITVNGISPDMIETKFLQDISDIVVEKNALSNPSGRNLKVEDVISTIQFLLSDGANMITGQNIAITGGR